MRRSRRNIELTLRMHWSEVRFRLQLCSVQVHAVVAMLYTLQLSTDRDPRLHREPL